VSGETETADPPLLEFKTIFDAEFSYVCRTLRRLGVAQGDIEDIAQEVFVSVYRRFADYDHQKPIRPWLFAFAFRFAGNYLRSARHRREVSTDAVPDPGQEGKGPEQRLAEQQTQQLVLDALQQVPLERRSALMMHDIDGFTAQQISEVMSIPVGTVYSRVSLARQEVRKAIQRIRLQGGDA